jgi:hypothetical protein
MRNNPITKVIGIFGAIFAFFFALNDLIQTLKEYEAAAKGISIISDSIINFEQWYSGFCLMRDSLYAQIYQIISVNGLIPPIIFTIIYDVAIVAMLFCLLLLIAEAVS